MRLTPIEIRQHRFGTRLRGLDPDEVHAFVDTVVEDFEEVVRENAQLRHDSERLLRELATYQGREKTIQDTLTTVQGVVDQLKQTAMKEAEVRVAEAEVRAEKLLKEAEVRRSMLQGEIGDLRRMRDRLQLDMRRMLEGYLSLVEPADAEGSREPGARRDDADDARLGYLDLPRRRRAEG